MRLILSRKGFDSSAGGCPSPILPDGRLLPLPIPDPLSTIRYGDLRVDDLEMGRLVTDLSRGRLNPRDSAHLDPDLVPGMLPRQPGWRPLLGQTGAAQGHLRRQGVRPGDLFLFFGLFRDAQEHQGRWRFVPGSRPRHVLWGWLQIGDIVAVDALPETHRSWTAYHPHRHGRPDSNNTLYMAADRLTLGKAASRLPGAGTFAGLHPDRVLTAPAAPSPVHWRLPAWFHPDGRDSVLSFHARQERWSEGEHFCGLRCASRGQEFVLNMGHYPESRKWLNHLLVSLA